MIGNDVVDLGDPETAPGAQHPRFDERVFAPEERDALARSGAPNRLRWTLWAAKEAAYKVARKLDPRVVFSPKRFVVCLDPTLRGEVRHGAVRFGLRIDVLPEAVHAIASSDAEVSSAVRSELLALPAPGADPGRSVRALAARSLTAALGARPGDVVVVKEGRVPRLEVGGRRATSDLSLSHHGNVVAWACEVSPLEEPA